MAVRLASAFPGGAGEDDIDAERGLLREL